MKKIIFFGLCILFLLSLKGVSATDITNCTNISTRGTYYLTKNITDSINSSCINISSDNVTLDCQGSIIDGNDVADYGIYINRIAKKAGQYLASNIPSNITINNCTVSDWDTANIYVYYANGVIIKNVSSISSPDRGILMTYAKNVIVNESSSTECGESDIQAVGSVDDNCVGIEWKNVTCSGGYFAEFYNTPSVIANKTLCMLELCNASFSTIDNVTIIGSSILDNNKITLQFAENITILNVNSSYNEEGIELYLSDNITIKDSVFDNNERGIILSRSANNLIYNCNMSSNTQYGIYFDQTTTTNNVVHSCRIRNSTTAGIGFLTQPPNNIFYNNFFNETLAVKFLGTESANSWNISNQTGTRIYSSGTNIGGNYWTNSSGDSYSDTCTDSNKDGFCDTAYNVSSNLAVSGTGFWSNVDYFPLSDEFVIIISNLSNYSTTILSTYITWNTNKNTNYTFKLFNDSSRTNEFQVATANNTNYLSTRTLSITNLLSSTTYYVNLTVCDSSKQCAMNNTFNFITARDATLPSFSLNKTNVSSNLRNNTDVQINITIKDDLNISFYTLTHNDTSDNSWINETIINFGGVGNVTMIWNFTISNFSSGGTFGWKVWANDTYGNINISNIYILVVNEALGSIPETFSNNKTNASKTTYNNTDVQINLTIEDNLNISAYTLTTNDTLDGSWANQTIINLLGNSNVTMVWNHTIGNLSDDIFGWRVWINNTEGKTNESNIYEFRVRIPINESSTQTLLTGLWAYYSFNEDGWDNTGNESVRDLNASGITYVADGEGNMGSAPNFDGSSYFVLGNSSLFPPSKNNFSYCFWFNASTETNAMFAIGNISAGLNDRLRIQFTGTLEYKYRKQTPPTSWTTVSSPKVGTNKWIFTCMIMNNTHLRIYRNETYLGTGYDDLMGNGSGLEGYMYIGSNEVPAGYFNGVIDNFGIWDRELNDSEVSFLYNNYDWYDIGLPTLSNATCDFCISGTNRTLNTTPQINVTCTDSDGCNVVRVSNNPDFNFGGATSSRNCTLISGTKWACKVPESDKLTNFGSSTTFYFLAKDVDGNAHSVYNLSIDLTLLGTLDNCSTYTNKALNVSFISFDTGTLLSTSYKYKIDYTIGDLESNYSNSGNLANFSLCLSSNNASLTGDLFIEYINNSVLYTYYVDSLTLTNITQNIILRIVGGTTDITATVYNQDNELLEDCYIRYLKYDVETNDYLLMGIGETNFEGESVLPLVQDTELYKFILYYPYDTLRQTSQPTYITGTTLLFQINTVDEVATDFHKTMDISSRLIFSNVTNRFTWTYSDSNSLITQACLNVFRLRVTGFNFTISETCQSSVSGVITADVTRLNGTTYCAEGEVTLSGEDWFIDGLCYTYPSKDSNPARFMGLLICFIMTIAFCFAFKHSIELGMVAVPLPLLFCCIMGIIDIATPIAIGIEIAAIILAIILNKVVD